MTQLFPYFLFLHVLGAILAFGPTFAYSIMGAMAGREPQHANFSSRQVAAIGNKMVYPLAVFQGITGLLLIVSGSVSMSSLWLGLGIVLYIVALVFALTVQRNTLQHLIEMTSTPPPPGTPPGPPPPALLATVAKIQRGGMFLGILIVVIVFLMVVKPTI